MISFNLLISFPICLLRSFSKTINFSSSLIALSFSSVSCATFKSCWIFNFSSICFALLRPIPYTAVSAIRIGFLSASTCHWSLNILSKQKYKEIFSCTNYYPCLCLWLPLIQIIRKRHFLFINLQLLHIFFTEDLTFIAHKTSKIEGI